MDLKKYFVPGTAMAGATVLITGAGSGIGREMALEAARRGAAIVIWDLSEASAQASAAMIRELGQPAWAYQVDVCDLEQIESCAKQTLAQVGHVDTLINCAGVVSGGSFLDLSDAQLRRTYDINTLALYRVTKQFLPAMIARRAGSVVNVASAAGIIGVARQTDYSGSKAAAILFSDSLRAEMRRYDMPIQVLAICPFYIDTGMFAGVKSKMNLLLPILKQEQVGKKVIQAIEGGRSRLILPWFARSAQLMRALPTPIFDILADLFGVNESMDEFVGRAQQTGRKPENNQELDKKVSTKQL